MVWLFEGQRRCFPFRSCICSALLWVGLCQCLLLIFCISVALKSPSWGSLTAFYTHTRLHIPQVRVHSLSPHCFIREKNLFLSHQLWKKALGCIHSGRGLYQTSSGSDLGTQTVQVSIKQQLLNSCVCVCTTLQSVIKAKLIPYTALLPFLANPVTYQKCPAASTILSHDFKRSAYPVGLS